MLDSSNIYPNISANLVDIYESDMMINPKINNNNNKTPNITEPTDDTPDIQEQETSQQKTQPQPQQEIKKTGKFDFNEYVQSTKAKIKKAQSLEQLPTETKQKTQNTEQLKKTKQISQSRESLIWWKTPISGESTSKCEKDPNDLYNVITQKERERYYVKTPEKGYNVPLLKDSKRRRRAILQRKARDSYFTGFDQGT